MAVILTVNVTRNLYYCVAKLMAATSWPEPFFPKGGLKMLTTMCSPMSTLGYGKCAYLQDFSDQSATTVIGPSSPGKITSYLPGLAVTPIVTVTLTMTLS